MSHQLLAAALPVFVWQHVGSRARAYLFAFLASFPAVSVLLLAVLLYRNAIGPIGTGPRRPAGNDVEGGTAPFAARGTATVTSLGDAVRRRLGGLGGGDGAWKGLRRDVVRIDLALPRPVRVRAGQYVGLCIPAVDKLSFLQVHPFQVTSWAEEATSRLQLLVEPRGGWTRKLQRYALANPDGSGCWALFSGPYGAEVSTSTYGIVLLVASGLGIAAQLPYLKQLIHNYNACRSHTRRVHLVWLLDSIGKSDRVPDPVTEGPELTACRPRLHLRGRAERGAGGGYPRRRPCTSVTRCRWRHRRRRWCRRRCRRWCRWRVYVLTKAC